MSAGLAELEAAIEAAAPAAELRTRLRDAGLPPHEAAFALHLVTAHGWTAAAVLELDHDGRRRRHADKPHHHDDGGAR